MKTLRIANVYVRDHFSGQLSETDSGYRFVYDSDYLKLSSAKAVSLTIVRQGSPWL